MGACHGKKAVAEPQAAVPTVLAGRPEATKPEVLVVESPTAATPTTAAAKHKTDAGADVDATPAQAQAKTPANAAQAVGEQAHAEEAAVDASSQAPEVVDSAAAVSSHAKAEEAAAASAEEPPASPVGVAERVTPEEAKADDRAAEVQIVAPAAEGHEMAVPRRERETCC